MSDATSRFHILLLVIVAVVKPSYTRCVDAPTLEDSCYARELQAAGLSWIPPRSCGSVYKYEVLYTNSTCNASDSTVPRRHVQHSEANVILTSSDTYCIRVRAVINESFYSNYSTCAQVASLEKDHFSNVTMHGDLCIPVTLCHHNQFPSKIILSKNQELLHLTWRTLEGRHNVNRTYNSTTDTNHFCFYNVTESFRFLEYCEEGMMPCAKHSSFCCNWLEFVTRTCVIVNGNGGCSDSLMKPFFIAPSNINSSLTPDSPLLTSTSSMLPGTATVVMNTNISNAVSILPGDNSLVVTLSCSIVLPLLAIAGIIMIILVVIWHRRHRQ